jgi:outer membrane protein TolC
MSVLAAMVLALLGALGTSWIVWLRRESERDAEALAEQMAAVTTEVAALRASIEALRMQISTLRGATDAARAELTQFVNGPPSVRRPSTASGA